MPDIVIFDLDGTLIDSAKTAHAAVSHCAREHGLPPVSEADVRAAIGIPNPDFYYRLYPDYPREQVAAFGHQVEKREDQVTREIGAALAFPGVPALLDSLKRDGFSLYIASTGDEMHVHGALEATGLGKYFDGIHCGEADKAGMLQRILSARPSQSAVMVGDTAIDANAARENGIPSIGAGYGYCSSEREYLFDRVARTVEEVAEIVHEL